MRVRDKALLICWLAMITIFSLDLLTTIIGVEILGATEINPFAFRLFKLGLIGYPMVLIAYAAFFYVTLEFLGLLYRASYRWITNNELNIKNEIAAYCFVASGYVLIDFIAVVQNTWTIFGLI